MQVIVEASVLANEGGCRALVRPICCNGLRFRPSPTGFTILYAGYLGNSMVSCIREPEVCSRDPTLTGALSGSKSVAIIRTSDGASIRARRGQYRGLHGIVIVQHRYRTILQRPRLADRDLSNNNGQS